MTEIKEAREGHEALVERIARDLENEGFSVRYQPVIGGSRPDIVACGPTGSSLVVEVKGWSPRGGNTARAIHQAELIQGATGADTTYVVMDKLSRNYRDKRVATPTGLILALREEQGLTGQGKTGAGRRPTASIWVPNKGASDADESTDEEAIPPIEAAWVNLGTLAVDRGMVFAAMPFDRQFDDTYFVAMTYAAEQVDAHCYRIDMEEFAGDIIEEMRSRIRDSIAVIADLSGANPNVLYEAGYAHAFEKPTIHICSTPLGELPFDVRNWNTLPYRLGQTSRLRNRLVARLQAALG